MKALVKHPFIELFEFLEQPKAKSLNLFDGSDVDYTQGLTVRTQLCSERFIYIDPN
jgi:hypothetical protein